MSDPTLTEAQHKKLVNALRIYRDYWPSVDEEVESVVARMVADATDDREPKAMTLSHDRLVLLQADRGAGGRVVLVRCPHTIGLAFDVDDPSPGYLALLPCPCNDPSEVLAELVPREAKP